MRRDETEYFRTRVASGRRRVCEICTSRPKPVQRKLMITKVVRIAALAAVVRIRTEFPLYENVCMLCAQCINLYTSPPGSHPELSSQFREVRASWSRFSEREQQQRVFISYAARSFSLSVAPGVDEIQFTPSPSTTFTSSLFTYIYTLLRSHSIALWRVDTQFFGAPKPRASLQDAS